MTEKRFIIDIWDRDLYVSNILIASVGIIFYGISPRVHFLFVALLAIIFLNFCCWSYTLEKGRLG